MRVLFTLFFCLVGRLSAGQLASPQIVHHSSGEYRAGMPNWAIGQDHRGILYFGNNEGLLTFNGRYWQLYQLPNRTVVRAIAVDTRQRIFVGGQDEFGYFAPDGSGRLHYHSLVPLLPPNAHGFADVWTIEVHADAVFFRSIRQIMEYRAGKLTLHRAVSGWAFMGTVNGTLYAQDRGRGLLRYAGTNWLAVERQTTAGRLTVTGVLPYGRDTVLVTTLKQGLFRLYGQQLTRLSTPIDSALFADRIYCAARIAPDWYALGTTSAGVFIVDKRGRPVQTLSSPKQLGNANVRAIRLDQQQNLWLALDDGIDFVAINNPIRYIHPDGGKNATGYALHVHNQTLYAGTSNGLYACPVRQKTGDISNAGGTFREVNGTKGQVWRLDPVGKQLLMSHETGLFSVGPDRAQPLYQSVGTWLAQPVSTTALLTGTYQGLRLLTKAAASIGGFVNVGPVGTSSESLRFLCVDSVAGRVWASHPNRGVFRMDLIRGTQIVGATRLYTDRQGLPSAQYNYVYWIRNRLVVGTEKGVYEYVATRDRFMPSSLFTPLLGSAPVQYLKQDNDGNIWFASRKRVGVVDVGSDRRMETGRVVYFPELTGRLVGGFEFIYPYNQDNVFVAVNRGFVHINYRQYRTQIRRPDVLLGRISAMDVRDSVVFGGYTSPPDGQPVELTDGMRSLRFEYTSTLFDQAGTLEFSYRLDGLDKDWSAWSAKSEKEYTNLPWGRYTFAVRARNSLGSESAVARYTFYVPPVWYESYWAILVYTLLGIYLLYRLFTWQKRRHDAEQAQLTYLHQLELDHNEQEIVRLRNEKLEADMDFKNRELASMTMQLAQRSEVLVKVREVVSGMAKKQDSREIALNFRQVLKLIRDVETRDADWGQFTLHFNAVNEVFFRALTEQYPELTPNDLKLCAFLRMNLSSKEIAQFMNITGKAVEVSRYRLRKKLRLDPEVNLYMFLIDFARTKGTDNVGNQSFE